MRIKYKQNEAGGARVILEEDQNKLIKKMNTPAAINELSGWQFMVRNQIYAWLRAQKSASRMKPGYIYDRLQGY